MSKRIKIKNKVVLIFANSNEESVIPVINSLIDLKCKFLRITENDTLRISNIQINSNISNYVNYSIDVNETYTISYSQIKSVWINHAGYVNLDFDINIDLKNIDEQTLKDYIYNELLSLRNFIYSTFEKKRCIGKFNLQNSNKLASLILAKNCGLNIPWTLITRDKSEIYNALKNYDCITKNIQDIYRRREKSLIEITYTSQIKSQDLENWESTFLNLIQEKIPSLFEARVFYFDNNFYSIYIKKNQEVDVRMTSNNRFLPFSLPEDLKEKIKLFMSKMGLISGSLDFGIDKSAKFWFYELNPVGQFGFVCNAYNGTVSQRIAKWLNYE
ncbi:MAG: hypothetical protein ACNS60_09735 [Candidatus Cyclobacteriaceae bacterium M2_1C_046]